jgi:hypothetical protein
MRSSLSSAYGLPVANADNLRQVAIDRGILPWTLIQKVPLETYLSRPSITAQEKEEAIRFAPQTEATLWERPDSTAFTGFATVGRHWVSVYVELPNPEPGHAGDPLIPITMEFKHGMKEVSIAPPSGVPKKNGETFEDCGIRIFREETGIDLRDVTLLARPRATSGRQCDQCFLPALGEYTQPLSVQPADPVSSKYLKVILVPRSELLLFLPLGGEACLDSSILQALLRNGELNHLLCPGQ